MHADPSIDGKPAKPRREFNVPAAIVLTAFGWLALILAMSQPLLAAVQFIGAGLGLLVTVRIVQSWRPQDRTGRR